MDGRQLTKKISVHDITLLAILTALLTAQEQALSFIPSIQLTVFLMVLYSKKLGLLRSTIIILLHTLLDNIIMASFNIFYTPFMFIGWMLIPLFVCIIFKKVNSNIGLSLIGVLCSFLYCWIFLIPTAVLTKLNVFIYLLNDIPYEIVMAISSFLTIILLYKPCSNFFDTLKK